MSKLLIGAIGATLLLIPAASNASVSIGGGTSVDVTGPTGNDLVFSLGYSDSGTSNPFTETLVWTNTLAGIYGISLTTTASNAGADNDVDIFSALLTGGNIVGSVSLNTLFNNDVIESYGRTGVELGAGTYTLTITGSRGSTGSFGGNVAFSAVPEPGTWATMLIGFGAMGFALRRRRQSKVAYAV